MKRQKLHYRHIFVPREFLMQHLEKHLNTTLLRHLRQNDSENPRRPSEMMAFLHAQMSGLQQLDTFCKSNEMIHFKDFIFQSTST